jgi:gluconolactonase
MRSRRWSGWCSIPVLLATAALAQLQPVEVASSDSFTEGPVFDSRGTLFFSNRTAVLKIAPDGSVDTWISDPDAGFNGHKVLKDGTHLVCAARRGAVLKYAPDGRPLGVASAECDGKPLRAPNDLTLDPADGIYFTDPGGSREAPIGTVHYVDAVGRTHLVAGGMRVPNGLVLSPNGKFLYVAETQLNRIVRFPVTGLGKLGAMQVFANLPSREGHAAEPDGLAVDTAGNLYVAHLGMSSIQVLDTRGTLIRTLPAGVYDASNLVFGGPDRSRLYITGSVGHRSETAGRVVRLELVGVRGIPSLLNQRSPARLPASVLPAPSSGQPVR